MTVKGENVIRTASLLLTILACGLALAAVLTFLIRFERVESMSGSLGIAAFGTALVVLALRRLDVR